MLYIQLVIICAFCQPASILLNLFLSLLGGKLRYLHIKKAGSSVSCGDCGCKLAGIATYRPRELANISKRKKTVQRAYGGSRCATCVRERIVRAFLVEEQKVVKKVMKTQAAAAALAAKEEAKKTSKKDGKKKAAAAPKK